MSSQKRTSRLDRPKFAFKRKAVSKTGTKPTESVELQPTTTTSSIVPSNLALHSQTSHSIAGLDGKYLHLATLEPQVPQSGSDYSLTASGLFECLVDLSTKPLYPQWTENQAPVESTCRAFYGREIRASVLVLGQMPEGSLFLDGIEDTLIVAQCRQVS